MLDKKSIRPSLIFIVFLFSFFLRFDNFDFGLPAQYHFDEKIATQTVENFLNGNFAIGRYNHPPLLKTISYLSLKIYSCWHGIPQNLQKTYSCLALRLTSVLIGSFTIIAVYFLARFFLGFEFALLCCALIAVSPLHVISSKYGTPDILLTFMFIISMICILNLYTHNREKDYFFCGLSISIAICAKYNGLFLYFSFLCAHLFYSLNQDYKVESFFQIKRWLCFICGNICGFASGFLPLFINNEWKYLIDSLFFEQNHLLKEGHMGLTVSGIDYYYVFYFIKSILPATGWILFMFIIAGILFAFLRINKLYLIMISSLLPYYVAVEHIYKIFPAPDRYILPLFPFYILFAVIFAAKFFEFIYKKTKVNRNILIAVLFIILLYYPEIKTLRIVTSLKPDTRDLMRNWIEKNIPSNTKIFVNWPVSGYYPEFSDNIKIVRAKELDYNFVMKFNIDYILLSSFEYSGYIENPQDYPNKTDFYLKIMYNHQLVHETKKPTGPYLFNNPILRLYKLNKSDKEYNNHNNKR